MNRYIVITGGHLTPALAVIEELHRVDSHLKIIFLGRETTDAENSLPSQEARFAEKYNYTFVPVTIAKSISLINICEYFKEMFRVYRLLHSLEVKLVLSFGGYLGVFGGLVSRLARIPLVTHEQTAVLSQSSKFLQRIGGKVLHSSLLKAKGIVVGLPIRPEFFVTNPKPSWLKRTKKPLLYITGGNQGATAINAVIFRKLPDLIEQFQVIHQTGSAYNMRDLKKAQLFLQQYPDSAADYLVKPWFEVEEVAWIMKHADCVISRSGANSVAELSYCQTPTLYVPLPYAKKNEQYHNATFARDVLGLAVAIENQDHFGGSLLSRLDELMVRSVSNTERYRAFKIETRDAAQNIVQVLNQHFL